MKKCRQCGEEKVLTEYYAHKLMPDGHIHQCKKCVKSRVKNHRTDNIEKVREYDRNRPNQSERNELNKAYQKESSAQVYEKKKEWRDRNKLKVKAHWMVNNAKRIGEIMKLPCEICGNELSEAHHDDYSKPLDVRWLCDYHHKEYHKEERKIKRLNKETK